MVSLKQLSLAPGDGVQGGPHGSPDSTALLTLYMRVDGVGNGPWGLSQRHRVTGDLR